MVYKIPIVPARYQIPVDVGELVCNTTTSVKNIIELDCLTVDTSARVFAFPDSNSILLVSKNRRTHVSQLVCVANKINISLKEMRLVAVSIAHLVPVSFTINASEITAQSTMFSGAHCTSLILCCNSVSAILSRSLGLIQNQMLLNQATLPASLACSAQADSCSFHLTTQVRLRKQVFAKLEPINLRVQQNDCMIFRTIFAQKIEPIMLSVHLPTVNTDQSFAVQVLSTMLCETSSVDTHPVVSTSISNSMVLHSNANVCEHWSGVRPEKTSLVVATNAITCSADRLRLLQEADPFTLLDYDDETLKQVDYITV